MYNFAKLFSLSQQQTFALYYSHIYREWRTKIRIYHKQNTITTQSRSSSSSIIVSPHSRITRMCAHRSGHVTELPWNAVLVSTLTQASGREFHSGTVLTKNECLYWAVCDTICLNLKLWWCLVLGSAGSKMASAWTGILHLTILKSMASRISRLRSLKGAEFRPFSNEDTLVKRL